MARRYVRTYIGLINDQNNFAQIPVGHLEQRFHGPFAKPVDSCAVHECWKHTYPIPERLTNWAHTEHDM